MNDDRYATDDVVRVIYPVAGQTHIDNHEPYSFPHGRLKRTATAHRVRRENGAERPHDRREHLGGSGAHSPNTLVLGERTVTGTLAYLGGLQPGEEYGMVIDMLADGRLDPEPFITGRIGLDEIVAEGLDRLVDPESDYVKILVKPE